MVSKLFGALSLLTLFVYSRESIAQNMAFSQVLTFDGTIHAESPIQYVGGGYSEGPAYTVPEGKIWKIESFTFYQPYGGWPGYMTLKVNSTVMKCTKMMGSTSFVPSINGPFWLKSGDVVRAAYMQDDLSVGYGGYYPFALSIIEFSAP